MTRAVFTGTTYSARRRPWTVLVWIAVLLVALLPLPTFSATGPVPEAAGPETFLENLDVEDELTGWRFRTGMFYSDNITLAVEDERDELVGVAEFGANWHSIGSRFAAAFDGTLAYRNYTRNDFDDEGRANFLALADFFIIPETLDWYISDRLANAPVDPLGSTSPINVQFVNVLETGPRLTLRPGSNAITFAVASADIHAEESPIDHARDTGTLSFMHDFGATSSAGIVADIRQVDFEDDVDADDFEQEEAHLVLERRTDTLYLSAGAGKSRFEIVDGISRDATTGWLRMRARRTSDSVIYAAVERTASDTATAMLRDEQLLEQGGVPSFIVTGDPFFSDNAVVRYTRGWLGHQWSLAMSVREFDYFVSPLDRKLRGVQLGNDFVISPRLVLSVSAAKTDIEYLDLEREDSVGSVFAEADYRINRDWSIATGVRYLDRDRDDPLYEFKETMLTLFLSYSPQRGGRQ